MSILNQPNNAQCVNCQTVTTSDGKTVWVCENCGEVNQAVTTSTPAVPGVTPAAEPETQTVDVTTAQAELDQAASQLGNQPVPAATPATANDQTPAS